jgi:transposase
VAAFRQAPDDAAWLGLTPQPCTSGGKERLGRIPRASNRYPRRQLYLGAMGSHRVAMRSRPMAHALGAPPWPTRGRLTSEDAGTKAAENANAERGVAVGRWDRLFA